MALLFRWLLRLTLGLIGVVAVLLLLAWWFAARSLPDYSGEVTVAGLDAPVEIVRDHANVPHILATTDAGAFFALGYVHAQDRLWQMAMLRRTAQGRLSELFGARTLGIDTLIRRLDLYGLAVSSVEAQDEATLAALAAYSAGVNARIDEVNDKALGRGAPEMWIFPQALAPWQPADSIAVLKLMALQLNGHIDAEVQRARASLLLPPERVADLLPDAPGAGVAALPAYAALVPGTAPSFAAVTPRGLLHPVQGPAFAGASNAWAAGVARSATGSTLLANDPHLGLQAPTLWFLARMDLRSGAVIGGTIPGMPLVLSGRSADLGWGLTSSYLDDADLHMEEVSPSDVTQYRTPDGWATFEARDSIVEVRGAPPVTLHLRWTETGPVLGPDDFDVGLVTPPGHVATLSWTALSDADTTMTAALRLMQADSVDEAVAAGELYVAPSQAITLADRNAVGLVLMGAMPARDPGHQSQGRMPTLGAEAANRWTGLRPYAETPRFIEPAGGIVGNTNNKILDAPFPDHLSFTWGDATRVERWRFLMQAREIHTRDSFIEAQLDTVSQAARRLLPLVGADLWFTGEAAPEGTPERQRQRALELLAEWNGEMNEHLPEPLLYQAWMRALQDRLIRDELGPFADGFTHFDPVFLERVFRDAEGAGAWCDVRQSAPVETCPDIARAALDDALVLIGDRWGTALESLRWGDAHEARSDHPVLGEVPVLSWLVNVRQSTSGDDHTLMRGRTLGTGPNPFLNVHAGAYRGVYDLADPDSSVFVTSTGQSGHPLSRHYDDLGERWRRGEYVPMSLDPDLARAAAVGTTVLRPEG